MGKISPKKQLDYQEVRDFMRTLSNWGKWGKDDQLGCLNYITPQKRAAAAALVRQGIAVSTSRPLPTETAADNQIPVRHLMVITGLDKDATHAADYFALSHHGYSITHLDALCHIFDKEVMYNGYAREKVTSIGADANSIDMLREGIVTRGILLDIPFTKHRTWLEPGEPIVPEDLDEAEQKAGVRVESGDFLLIRTGRFAYRNAHGPWNARELLAGLHASCLPWLYAREVASLGCDGVSDVIPSRVPNIRLPIHLVAMVALGLHLLDNADLEALSAACAQRQQWEFLFVVAPLVLLRGTGSPVNPLAVF